MRQSFVGLQAYTIRRVTTNAARAFRHGQTGSAAVEFALIAAPFLALLYAILETALVFFAQQTLQTATTQSARLIMTGQAQTQNMTANQFQQTVCGHATALFNCAGIYVSIQKFSSFSSVSMLNPIKNGTFNGSGMSYNLGGPGDIELVQVFYQWPVYAGPLGFTLSNTSGGNDVIVATAAFRNEPYK
jgi:Flp pilus assembly protein TadG